MPDQKQIFASNASLSEACIILVQGSSGINSVDLSLLNASNFEDIKVLEEIIAVLTYVSPRDEIATSPEQDFVQQVISRCSTENLHNMLNTPDLFYKRRLQNSTPENEIIKLRTRSIEEAHKSTANSIEFLEPESTVSTSEQLLSSTSETSSNQSLRNVLSPPISIAKQV